MKIPFSFKQKIKIAKNFKLSPNFFVLFLVLQIYFVCGRRRFCFLFKKQQNKFGLRKFLTSFHYSKFFWFSYFIKIVKDSFKQKNLTFEQVFICFIKIFLFNKMCVLTWFYLLYCCLFCIFSSKWDKKNFLKLKLYIILHN